VRRREEQRRGSRAPQQRLFLVDCGEGRCRGPRALLGGGLGTARLGAQFSFGQARRSHTSPGRAWGTLECFLDMRSFRSLGISQNSEAEIPKRPFGTFSNERCEDLAFPVPVRWKVDE